MRAISMMLGASIIAVGTQAAAQDIKFKPIVEARLRYETVEQDGPAPITKTNDANASTVRLRAGGELSSGPFAFLAETEGTLAIGKKYNSGVNGKTTLPIIADPDNVELNRIQVQYRTKPLVVTVGRQRINLDDQRFVGSVGWRQNEQTFDAARIEIMAVKNLKIDVTYAIAANTIWGIDGGKFGAANRPTRIEGDNVFATAAYTTKIGTLTAFAYLVDQDEPVVALQRNSSQTYGLRFAGSKAFSKTVKLSYMASYANQSDASNNPVNYTADYGAAELALDVGKVKLTGGYELLGSDATVTGIAGGYAFQTPFATLHKFNGWADKFLATPATGIQDYYAGITYTLPKIGKMGPLAASVSFHRYDSDRNSIHYGDEYNAQLSLKLDKRMTLLLKYADYQRQGIASFAGDADTKKFWAQLEYAL
jgi:hypothetical protein